MRLCNSISWALLREPKPRAYLLFISRAQRRWLQSPFSAANANYKLEVGNLRRSWKALRERNTGVAANKARLPLWVRRSTGTGRMLAERLRLLMVSLPSGDGL